MNVSRVQTELSAQYVDHNIIQEDYKNPDDHRFLFSACQRYGIWYSPPGNGVSHPVHQERFGIPGKTMLGSDSHTPAAGAIGMLAIGAGGLEVALAMAGEPFHMSMPEVWGVKLTGELPDWVSAKDVILEMLRRHDVHGGRGRVIEYYGRGLESLSVMDRHVIANMGTELGATSSVFPSDSQVQRFLARQQRDDDWTELTADDDATYDVTETIDLSKLEPLVALPCSPGNVASVREVAGQKIYQSYIGSSANPGYRDFAVAAEMVRDRHVHPEVSLDVNPTSRQILEQLTRDSRLAALIHAGARIHQAGCNGCIGMGQAPATESISLRTVPRNFPGRSGTREDKVHLVSPETATASALRGVITDPRDLEMDYPRTEEPAEVAVNSDAFVAPLPPDTASNVELVKGPNISTMPRLEPLPDELHLRVLVKAGDNVSTDEILPAGTRVLPLRSNIPAISRFSFEGVDASYPDRTDEIDHSPHAVLGGHNYGQGSSREHAALAPRSLGLRVVLTKSFARIHQQNLINYGVLPLTFQSESDFDRIEQNDELHIQRLHEQMNTRHIQIELSDSQAPITAQHALSAREIDIVRQGGMFEWIRHRREQPA